MKRLDNDNHLSFKKKDLPGNDKILRTGCDKDDSATLR